MIYKNTSRVPTVPTVPTSQHLRVLQNIINANKLNKKRHFIYDNKEYQLSNTINFKLKNNYFIGNKQALWLNLKKYNLHHIMPHTYSMPNDYSKYLNDHKGLNTKMIFKTNSNKQEGLFITNKIQPLFFINNERFIVAQEYINNTILFSGRKLNFRFWLLINVRPKLSKKTYEVRTLLYNDGLVYYTSDINTDIASFYNTSHLYDIGYPATIKEFEKQTNIKVFELAKPKLASLSKMIKLFITDSQNTYYKSEYFELLGIDVIITNDNNAYVLEANVGPGMKKYSEKDGKIRRDMMTDYVRLAIGQSIITTNFKQI